MVLDDGEHEKSEFGIEATVAGTTQTFPLSAADFSASIPSKPER